MPTFCGKRSNGFSAHIKHLNKTDNPAAKVAKSRSGILWAITICLECEGRIEKYVPRIAVGHHETCPVMTNDDPEGQIFLSYPHTNNGFLFLLTTVFIYLFIISILK